MDYRTWRCLDTGLGPGDSNMALDESLALCQRTGKSLPTLRLYGWDPPAVSLGRFQDIYAEIDYLSCRAQGFDVIRRPTGGKAILHLEDVTYSVTLPLTRNDPSEARSLFRCVADAVIASMEELGIESDLATHRTDTSDPWCFTRPFGVDISSGGRKICGSAHRIYAGTFLQHGTMFLKTPEDILPSLAPSGSNVERDRWAKDFRRHVISLSEALERDLLRSEVCAALKRGFARYFDAKVIEDEPEARELELAERLLDDKYGSGCWLFNRKRETA